MKKKEEDPYELIEKLAQLKTSGIITEEEFSAKKEKNFRFINF